MTKNYIHLVGNLYFTADQDQYILCVKRYKECKDWVTKLPTGKVEEVYDSIGFYTSLTSLIRATARCHNRLSIERGELTNLKDCVNQITTTYHNVLNSMENL